jgi:transglutaminase-like putative cysteine protease
MPRFIIHHVTKYTYPDPVRDSANQIILYPIKDEYQDVLSHQLIITGEPNVEKYRDYYGNEIGTFMNIELHKELRIDSTKTIVTKERVLPNVSSEPKDIEEQWNHLYQIKNVVPFIDFLIPEFFEASPEVKKIADPALYKSMPVFEAAKKLTDYVYKNFNYIKGVTNTRTTIDEVWKLKAGVCQDFAHILSVMFRLINIPARYVSGYVCPKDKNLRGEGATHAWVEAYVPFYGWIGLDPTNNCIVNDLHVRLAIGRNFSDCSPVKGTYKGSAKQSLEVGVSVSYEDGAVSKEVNAILEPQYITPVTETDGTSNSFRRYNDMMKIQQQQQQQ